MKIIDYVLFTVVCTLIIVALAITLGAQEPPAPPANCVAGALVQSVTPVQFEKVPPGGGDEPPIVSILIENRNPQGCPGAPVILTAESVAPFTWPVALEGGAKWVVMPGASAFTRLHIAVPKDATTGSYQINYTLDRGFGLPPIVTPIIVNVWAVISN